MKPLKALIILSLFIFSLNLKAEVFRWPQACLSGILQITNLVAVDQRIWLQKFKKNLQSETTLNLKASAVMKYNLKAASLEEKYSVLNLNGRGLIDVQFVCNQKTYPANTFEGGNLTYRKSAFRTNQVWLQNLFTGNNSIHIEFQNERFESLTATSLHLKSLEKMLYTVPTRFSTWTYLKIWSRERFTAFNLSPRGSENPFLVNPTVSAIDNHAHYFLIGPRSGIGDSYVAKITDPFMLQRAREQVAHPELEQMVFAKIEKGSQGYNRNWDKKEKSFWSWSITEVTNFADFGSTTCNGLPQIIEDRIDDWAKNPGRICFWSYRIKRELSPYEVENGL